MENPVIPELGARSTEPVSPEKKAGVL